MNREFYEQSIGIIEKGPIDIITIKRPPLNLLSNELKDQLFNCLIKYKENRITRVAIIKSDIHDCFCAGADLKEFPRRIEEKKAGEVWESGHRLFSLPRELSQVFISAVDGLAFGGGAELALSCDIIVGSNRARIGLPEVTKGIMPGCGGIKNLYDRVGYPKALQLLLTGEILHADEAHKVGMIDIYCADEDPVVRALELAKHICKQPGLAVSAIKKTLVDYKLKGYDTYLENGKAKFQLLHDSNDCKEGLSAFFEKRTPTFTHR